MLQRFATEFDNGEFLQHYVAKLPWTSITTIMDQVKDKEQRKWYINESIRNGWARPVIIHQIASKLYERQALLENKSKLDASNLLRCSPKTFTAIHIYNIP